MGTTVELREKPRVFEVWVGENSIGEVISYRAETIDDDTEDAYEAFLYKSGGDEGERLALGWYETLRLAALRILHYAHGEDCTIDAIKKRKV